MFWIGIAISVLAFLAEFEPVQSLARRRFAWVRKGHFHTASAGIFMIGIAVAIGAHRYDVSETKTLQKQLSKVSNVLAPRTLSPSQRQVLVDAWRPFAGRTAKVQRRGELEAYRFANEIIATLQEAGLSVQVEGGLNELWPPQYGIYWWVSRKSDPLAVATGRAFKEIGLPNEGFFVDGGADLAIRVGLKHQSGE